MTTTTAIADPPSPSGHLSIGRLILVPALITLAVTALRLVGELLNWSPRLFSREAGGAGALIGIVWLVPIFGVYFARKLVQAGQGPASAGAASGFAVGGLLAIPLAGFAAHALGLQGPAAVGLFALGAVVAMAVAWRGWPALGRTLFAYGLAARIPVALVMLVAMLAKWGTHYEKGPPDFPQMGVMATWFWIGLLPQVTFWIAFTVVVGCLVGGITAAVSLRGRRTATA